MFGDAVALLELLFGDIDGGEVGHRCRHDHDIATRCNRHHLTVHFSRSGDGSYLHRGETPGIPSDASITAAVTRTTSAPRMAARPASACPCLPEERFPMNRTGSMGSRVPPAVTNTFIPCRSPEEPRTATAARRGSRRVLRDGRGPRPLLRDDPTAGPTKCTPRLRSRATLSATAGCSHISVCMAGADQHRGAGSDQHIRQQVVGVSMRIGGEQLRSGGRHDDQVGVLPQLSVGNRCSLVG